MTIHSFRGSLPLLMLGASLAVACGGTTTFQDKSAVAITGDGPEEPKPKPKAKPKKKRVEVKATKIEISDKILFGKGTAEILKESDELLDEIVEVIKENPKITKISIEGHTSSEGSADFNRKLSNDRAQAVMKYLTDHGIDVKRLEAKGFGPDKPLAGNDTEDDREKNRRVEFNIVTQAK
ncbi:MAG TPA: OmpA family protein [Polyangiaceae bacterium]|nr:OmpA family protein [Polyangiaceae bacterium]